jgi:hypothetical protein
MADDHLANHKCNTDRRNLTAKGNGHILGGECLRGLSQDITSLLSVCQYGLTIASIELTRGGDVPD